MSTPTFDESQHPRGTGGKFSTKPAAESTSTLGTPVYQETSAVRDEVRTAFPDARALRVDVDITGSSLGDVIDQDGKVLGSADEIPGLHDKVDDSMEADADSWRPVGELTDEGAFDGGTYELDISGS